MPVRAKGRCSVMYVVITILWYMTNKVLHLVCACKIEGELLLVKQENHCSAPSLLKGAEK